MRFFGVGSTCMSAAGVSILFDSKKLETFGFQSAFRALPRHIDALRRIKKAILAIKPRTFIAVAYPGMNLLLVRYARRLGCEIHYLLPPQAWAWGAFRANLIARWVDTVISVFPFEYEFYKRSGIEVRYWENPLRRYLKHYARTDMTPCIGFMPGSRRSEIQRNLPVIAVYLVHLHPKKRTTRFALILHDHEVIAQNPWFARTIRGLEQRWGERFVVYTKDRYAAMKNCDLLIACSGTASLEAAFMDIPQVFFNRCSWFDYTFVRPLLSIREYNLANLYFGKAFAPSCVHCSGRVLLSFLKNIAVDTYIN